MRRACSAVAAGVLLATAALPAVMLAGLPPASASTSQATGTDGRHQPGDNTVAIAITAMNPQIATLGTTVTLSGTVSNHSRQTLVDPKVRFLVGQVPVGDMSTLMADNGDIDGPLGSIPIPGRATQPAAQILPGASSYWSVTVPVSRLGLATFGAYPVTVQVIESGIALANANSFLPYTPPKRGRFAAPSPHPQRIAWVLPLIDQPLTGVPGSHQCQSAQAAALAASLARTGRLTGLLSAGTTKYGRDDQVTWAVDPALLWDANELKSCAALEPGRAAAASAWLREVKAGTAGQPLFTTPYANVSMALVSEGRANDVANALQDGRFVAQQYLHRDLTPKPLDSAASMQAQTAGTLWPPDGVASESTVESFAQSSINSVLLSSAVVTGSRATASVADSGSGGHVRILRYNANLSQLLAHGSSTPGDRFGTEQAFLAATAVLAAAPSSQPILVVPPQLWHASGGLVADLLAETARASWLSPVSMATLADDARPADVGLPPTGAERPTFSPRVIGRLYTLSRDINQLSSLHAHSSYPGLQLALYALESASRRLRRTEVLDMITRLDESVTSQLRRVGLDIKGPIYLGGLKGNVPLIIDNALDFPIKVRLATSVTEPGSGGFTVQQAAKGTIVVPAHDEYPTSLHVEASQAGAATIRLWLVNDRKQALPGPPVSVTVHATQFGTLAMIILASALGVFVIASAARGLRRRPTGPDNPADGGHLAPDDVQGGEITAEPDTVVAEHSELGAAGRSGL